jgi:hypothetical protein
MEEMDVSELSPAARAALGAGIESSLAGAPVYLGDFSKYLPRRFTRAQRYYLSTGGELFEGQPYPFKTSLPILQLLIASRI